MEVNKQTKSKTFLGCTQKTMKNHYQLAKNNFESNLHKDDTEGHAINLSKYSVTIKQFKILNKNLNFHSTPGYYNNKEIESRN